MNSAYLSKLHGEILEIMDVIDALCRKHHLRYYLTGGSLLGAVRHGGFIPWDDDLDIVMPRQDFDAFMQLCPEELPAGYHLRWITTDENHFRLFAKVCKQGTQFVEKLGKNSQVSWGIFVDVFPADEIAGYSRAVERRKWMVEKLKVMLSGKSHAQAFGFPKRVLIRMLSCRQMHRLAEKIMTAKNGKGYGYYTNYVSIYPVRKRTIPKAWMGEGIRLPFEDRNYCVPVKYDLELENVYGKNYMQVPPVEKRRSHYPVKVVFSDGQVMEFEEAEHKVTAKETLED